MSEQVRERASHSLHALLGSSAHLASLSCVLLSTFVQQMYQVGARKFLVFNIFPGGDVPYSLYSFNTSKPIPLLNFLTFHHNRCVRVIARSGHYWQHFLHHMRVYVTATDYHAAVTDVE